MAAAITAAIKSAKKRRDNQRIREEEEDDNEPEEENKLKYAAAGIDPLLILYSRIQCSDDKKVGRKELLVLVDIIETRNLEMIENPLALVKTCLTLMGGTCPQSRIELSSFVRFFRSLINSRNPSKDYPMDLVSLRYSVVKLSEKMRQMTGIHDEILPYCIYPASASGKETITSLGMCTICRSSCSVKGKEEANRTCLPCGGGQHIFHEACIVEWLEERQDCPLCRRNVMLSQVELASEAKSLGLFSLRLTEKSGDGGEGWMILQSLQSCSVC